MRRKNLKTISRSHRVDIGGQLFLQNRLKFRFIKKWIFIFEEDILKIEKGYQTILEKFKKKQSFFRFKKRLKRLNNRKGRKKYLRFNFKFDVLDHNWEKELKQYLRKVKVFFMIKYRIRYDQFNKRLTFTKRLFKQKQRFKVFWNLKEFQFRNLILKFKKHKFKYIDFFLLLEYRIDMILYRSFFFPSLLVAQQYIKTYGVYINNIFIKKHNYIVNIGDKIEINKSIKSLVYLIFLLKKKILNSPSKHLEINYINLNIIVKSFFLYSSQNNRKDRIKTFRRTKLIARNDREKNFFRWRRRFNNNFVKRFKKKRRLKYKRIENFFFLKKRQEQNFKKIFYFKIIQELLSIYYPFKLSYNEIMLLFKLY